MLSTPRSHAPLTYVYPSRPKFATSDLAPDRRSAKRVPDDPPNAPTLSPSPPRRAKTRLHPSSPLTHGRTNDNDDSARPHPSPTRRQIRRPKEAHDILDEMPELAGEISDELHDLPSDVSWGAATFGAGITNKTSGNHLNANRARKDPVLGRDPNAKLATFYLVSGLPKDHVEWSFADAEATRGLRPQENSLGHWWRPDILGTAFSGQTSEDWIHDVRRARKESRLSGTSTSHLTHAKVVRSMHVPDAGPDGASKLLLKTMKYAHPRDLEVINSSVCPPTTTHAFSFTIPKHDTLSTIARLRLDGSPSPPLPSSQPLDHNAFLSQEESYQIAQAPVEAGLRTTRNMSAKPELTFYGLTLTIWTHADSARARALKNLRRQKDTHGSSPRDRPLGFEQFGVRSSGRSPKGEKKTPMPWSVARKASMNDVGVSMKETLMGESDLEVSMECGRSTESWHGLSSVPDGIVEAAGGVVDDGGDHFWMPYALTLISRYPIFDFMQDFLRLSWTRYQKNAKFHMDQVCRLLRTDPPRPGDVFRMDLSSGRDSIITIEAKMPGALDFDRGIVSHVDFQIWPMFQALDLDHIITCVEIALSASGRIIFTSSHPPMLNICVSGLKLIVDMRGWNGIAHPGIHARDMGFTVEDPGPYIVGMSAECSNMIRMPAEVAIIDVDNNILSCQAPPPGVVTSRQKREKMKQKLLSAFGPSMPREKSVPHDFKASYSNGTFRHLEKVWYAPGSRPSFLGPQVRVPGWWKYMEVMGAFDKIMADKQRKPSLLERITKTGMARQKAQPTQGELLARRAMRHRALHYVETRDSLEIRVSTVNRRLQKLMVEGEHWKAQFEQFEKYAEKLAHDSLELKAKIDREKKEARRLSAVAFEKSQMNAELEEKLKNTESARAEAMRQLSDMHDSIQELEKEREALMSHFETQLDSVLATMPVEEEDAGAQAGPEGQSASTRTIRRRNVRPGTSDSVRSELSRFTTESTISVLGAAKGVTSNTVERSCVRPGTMALIPRKTGDGRNEDINSRIAAITAKLEIALSTVGPLHDEPVSGTPPEPAHPGQDDAGGPRPAAAERSPTETGNDDDISKADRRISSSTFANISPIPTVRDDTLEVEVPSSPGSVKSQLLWQESIGMDGGRLTEQEKALDDIQAEPVITTARLGYPRKNEGLRALSAFNVLADDEQFEEDHYEEDETMLTGANSASSETIVTPPASFSGLKVQEADGDRLGDEDNRSQTGMIADKAMADWESIPVERKDAQGDSRAKVHATCEE